MKLTRRIDKRWHRYLTILRWKEVKKMEIDVGDFKERLLEILSEQTVLVHSRFKSDRVLTRVGAPHEIWSEGAVKLMLNVGFDDLLMLGSKIFENDAELINALNFRLTLDGTGDRQVYLLPSPIDNEVWLVVAEIDFVPAQEPSAV